MSKQTWSVPAPPPEKPAISGLDYEGLNRCIHCGFCLQACPTYRQTGVELHSPRGRLMLLRAAAEGHLPVDSGLAEPLDACLGCRACETACPSGVPYGRLLVQARALTAPVAPPPWPVRFALRHLLPYPARLRAAAALARLAQRVGLFRLLPAALRRAAEALPPLAAPRPYPVPAAGAPGALFFAGCIQEALLQPQNRAAVAVIGAAAGSCAVPPGQTCCGALHAHAGDLEAARALARRNIAAFEAHPGPVINHAGGCGAHLKVYGHLLRDDPAWAERARAFAARVRDLSEWLAETGLAKERLGALPMTVTYQDSCHLAHGQGVRRAPRELLRAIPGIDLREMSGADQCCGSAGLYSLTHPDMSGKLLAEKLASVAETGARVLVTSNPGCYLHLRQGAGPDLVVVTLAELLEDALNRNGNDSNS